MRRCIKLDPTALCGFLRYTLTSIGAARPHLDPDFAEMDHAPFCSRLCSIDYLPSIARYCNA